MMAEFRGTVHCLKNVIVAIKLKKKEACLYVQEILSDTCYLSFREGHW